MNLDLPLIILALTIVSGAIYLLDVLFWSKHRVVTIDANGQKSKPPLLIDYARSLFPIFVIVLIIRSFVGQAYRVPTGSLEPTVMPGDFTLVTQFNYGLNFPVWHWRLLNVGNPQRGQIAVMHWPVNPNMDFIKRVIGVPGDKISYINKVLYVNGKEATQTFIKNTKMNDGSGNVASVKEMRENLDGVVHDIYIEPGKPSQNFKNLVVPKGEYFVMGDNRDDSDDSRYWGFVPRRAFVGKANYIVLSWDGLTHDFRWDRIGQKLV